MSWLSTIGKIAAIGGAPFTGGASLAAIPMIDKIGKVAGAVGDVSSVLGKQQSGKAAGQQAQANAQMEHDRNAIALYQAQQAAQNQAGQQDLDRKKFEQSSRGTDHPPVVPGSTSYDPPMSR